MLAWIVDRLPARLWRPGNLHFSARLHFATPEEAALDGWPEAARAHVVSVDVRGDRAEVVIDTDPHYPYWCYCRRDRRGWYLTVDGNGPTARWWDPDEFEERL